jgi:tetratricopeptide (TPR) repeat protein
LALQALAWRGLLLEDLLISAGFFVVTLSGVRNTPLFFIAALPAAGLAIQALVRRPLLCSRAAAWCLAGLLLLSGARVATSAWYASEGRQVRFGSGLLAGDRLPLGAAAYIKAWAPQARFFNSTEYGGWLCYASGHAVFQDGQTEVMEQETYKSLIEPSLAPGGLGRLMDAQGLNLLVYHRPNYETYTRQMLALPGWRLAYYDDWAALWMRDGAFAQAPRVDWAFEARQGPALPANAGQLLLTGAPAALPRFLRGFWQGAPAITGEANRAAFAWQCGAAGLAEALLWDALAKDPASALAWHNLGVLLSSQGRYEQALPAWRHCLACDPDDLAAREACRQLGGG